MTVAIICRILTIFDVFFLQKNKKDPSNFDSEFTKEDPVLTPVNPEVVRTINQQEFGGFSFYNQDFGKLATTSSAHYHSKASSKH